MPYITQSRRSLYNRQIEHIVKHLGAEVLNGCPTCEPPEVSDEKAKGDLNYIIFKTIKNYVEKEGMCYSRAQDFIGGVLTSCQLELYRRLLAPYEDPTIEKNGDVI